MKTKHTITHVDATGLNCPMPLMLLKKTVNQVSAGDVIEITVTDIHAELDFEIWCEKFGHELIKLDEHSDRIKFSVVKGIERSVLE